MVRVSWASSRSRHTPRLSSTSRGQNLERMNGNGAEPLSGMERGQLGVFLFVYQPHLFSRSTGQSSAREVKMLRQATVFSTDSF